MLCLGHTWEMLNRWFLIKMRNVRQSTSLGLNCIFSLYVKPALSQRVIRFQVTSHTYVFPCFCNSSIQSSPWSTRKRSNRRSDKNAQPSQTAIMALWHTCFPIWNCCQVFLSKDLCFRSLKDYDNEVSWLFHCCVWDVPSLKYMRWELGHTSVLPWTVETHNSDPSMKMKSLTEFPCFLYSYQKRFLQELYWSFWVAQPYPYSPKCWKAALPWKQDYGTVS